MTPNPWKTKPLASIAHIQTGIAKGAKKVKNPVELPYLRVANVQDGHLDLSYIKTIEIDSAQIERYRLQIGDVLLTEGGDFDKLGRGAVWKGEIDKCVHQNHIFVARPKSEVLLSDYLSLLTGSHYGKTYFRKCSKQSTNLASINSTQLKAFPVLLPSLPEQQSITSMVATWDLAIEKTERLVAAKERHYSWFLRTLIDDKCSNWKHLRADKIFKSISEKGNGGGELLSVTQDRGVIPRTMLEGRVMSPEGGTESYKLIKKGDFAISLRSFQGGIEYSVYQGLISPAYTVLRSKVELYDEFYRHFFKSYIFIEKYLSMAVIGIRDGKQISIPDFMTVKIPLPPIDEQKQIAAILNTAQQEIDLLKKQADAYRRQKRGLMQKLLTGEWRVKAEEATV